MAKEVFMGQTESMLGPNPNPMIHDGAAPAIPVQTKQGEVEIPRLVKLMAMNDGIEPSAVTVSSEIRKGREAGSLGGITFIDGDSMTPVQPPVALQVLPDPKKKTNGSHQVLNGSQSSTPGKPQGSTRRSNGSAGRGDQQQSEDFRAETSEDFKALVELEVVRRLAEAVPSTFEVEFRSGYLTVLVPVVSVSVSGVVVMVHTPVSNKTRLEPPRGEEVVLKVPEGTNEQTGLASGAEHTLFCTGIYSDIPKFGVRCSVFFIKPGE